MAKAKQPPSEPVTAPELDLREHQGLIIRAFTESAKRRARRPVLDAISAPSWQLVLVGIGADEAPARRADDARQYSIKCST